MIINAECLVTHVSRALGHSSLFSGEVCIPVLRSGRFFPTQKVLTDLEPLWTLPIPTVVRLSPTLRATF